MAYPEELDGKFLDVTRRLIDGAPDQKEAFKYKLVGHKGYILNGQENTIAIDVYKGERKRLLDNYGALSVLNNKSDPTDAQSILLNTNPGLRDKYSKGALSKKVPWSLKYLKYVQGYATVAVRDAGAGVLSGPFSGCYYMKFNWKGRPRAVHIGTATENSEPTKRVKLAWKEFLEKRADVDNVKGCQPCAGSQNTAAPFNTVEIEKYLIGTPEIGSAGTRLNRTVVLGYIPTNDAHDAYALHYEFTDKNSFGRDLLEVIEIKKMEMEDRSAIKTRL